MTAPGAVKPDAVKEASDHLSMLVGLAAVVFSALYFVSDLVEFAQGGFSTPQLALTYVAEAAIPLFVARSVRDAAAADRAAWPLGAVGYAYSFIFFTSTVVVALVEPDERLGRSLPSSARG